MDRRRFLGLFGILPLAALRAPARSIREDVEDEWVAVDRALEARAQPRVLALEPHQREHLDAFLNGGHRRVIVLGMVGRRAWLLECEREGELLRCVHAFEALER